MAAADYSHLLWIKKDSKWRLDKEYVSDSNYKLYSSKEVVKILFKSNLIHKAEWNNAIIKDNDIVIKIINDENYCSIVHYASNSEEYIAIEGYSSYFKGIKLEELLKQIESNNHYDFKLIN